MKKLLHKDNFYPKAHFHENGVFSRNYFNTLTIELARRCYFINPEKCTSHGCRKEGASAMSNHHESLDPKLIMGATHHKTMTAHQKYLRPNEDSVAKKYRALAHNMEVSNATFLF